jgi:putative ABC transport system ATP-binding protein
MTALLEVRSVSKQFVSAGETLHVLKGVSLALEAGDTVAVTGPSGSGKSTLLGLMAGLERPSSGSILCEGRPIQDLDEDRLSEWRRRSVGFVFQNFRLVPSLTAAENAALPLEILGRDVGEAAERAGELLRLLDLGGRLGHFPHQLSGGEQQRVALARAFIHEPALILADEPTGSVDREHAGVILDSLMKLNSARGATLVVATHDPAVASRMTRAISLDRGAISG